MQLLKEKNKALQKCYPSVLSFLDWWLQHLHTRTNFFLARQKGHSFTHDTASEEAALPNPLNCCQARSTVKLFEHITLSKQVLFAVPTVQ